MKTDYCYAVALLIALNCGAAAAAPNMSGDQYRSARERLAAEVKSARLACSSLSGNASAVCRAEANRQRVVATAVLEAEYLPSQSGSYKSRVALANADYSVARRKCDDKAGSVRSLCVRAARSAQIAARAEARSLDDFSLAHRAAGDKAAAARKAEREQDERTEANKDTAAAKRATDYRISKERCEELAGDGRSSCLRQSKERFGPS